ncbi:MAG: type II toxin-antitoxin system PemK/MazF family toxin [archaeon]
MTLQREIVLVPFPFSDQTGNKVRPALVLSKDSFNSKSKDTIICGITSNLSKDFYSVLISPKDLEEGRIETSIAKVENLAKIEQRLVIKKIGKLNTAKFEQILDILTRLFKD